MKGKIDDTGRLSIERGAKMKHQICPFSLTPEFPMPCGDFCPLFGEPKQVVLDTLHKSDRKQETALIICHGKTLLFKEFTDDRVEGKES